jgi:hypothetical protein
MRFVLWPAYNFFILSVLWIAPSSSAAQIDLDSGAIDKSSDPAFNSNIQRADFSNSFDGDLGTLSYMTNSGSGPGARIVAYNFTTGIQPFNRIRISEVSNNDGNGPVTLKVYYYNGPSETPFLNRNYLPVTGLAVVETDVGDFVPSGSTGENVFTHFDVANDGYYSLQFDEVLASGFAFVFDTGGTNTHYHVREIEAHAADSAGEGPDLLVAETTAIEVNAPGKVSIPISNGSQDQDLEISAIEITGGAQIDAFSNVQFPATLAPLANGNIELAFDNGNDFTEFEVILTISSTDLNDPERAVTVVVTAEPPPIPPTDTLINIVYGIVDPGPGRTAAGSEFELAFDGDITTRTFTTNSGTTTAPQRSLLSFEEGTTHNLTRIRINDVAGNDTNGRIQQLTVRTTTDSDPVLTERTYSDVINLFVILFEGDAEPLPNTDIISNTIEHLDTIHDGFYSIVFNTVPGATGIELEWANEGGFKHWTIREIEAYATGAPVSFNIIDSSFNEDGKPVIVWESVQNIIYAIDMSYDLTEWLEITDDLTGQAGTTPFVHEDFEDGTARIFYRIRTQ